MTGKIVVRITGFYNAKSGVQGNRVTVSLAGQRELKLIVLLPILSPKINLKVQVWMFLIA
jgi:hypothetical protein